MAEVEGGTRQPPLDSAAWHQPQQQAMGETSQEWCCEPPQLLPAPPPASPPAPLILHEVNRAPVT